MMKKIIGIVVVCLVFVACGLYYILQREEITKETFLFEYGQEVKLDTEEIYGKKIDCDIDLSKVKDEVGTYTARVKYSKLFLNYEDTIQVQIEDTTPPEFVKTVETIELNEEDSSLNLEDYIQIEDKSECKLVYDLSQIQFHVVGTYVIDVQAVDVYENSSSIQVQVQISSDSQSEQSQQTTMSSQNEETTIPSQSNGQPYYVQGVLIVNKKHGLSSNYAPGEDPTAGAQIRRLIADMQNQGYAISSSYSGYRSYSYQAGLYNNYVNNYGQEQADRFSARPGYSEHQTGLAFDLCHTSGVLIETQPEVDWIANHAHEYGFIVRYPQGKESITGYMPEPWHLRYVGNLASEIYASGLTLEEYFGVSGGTSY